ncbi:magnesium transporter [Desulfovibrio sp. OttesenSCG-928-G15]|nr:magnesium transporter [Desulfovibrio sp. OttesenSCG-928-G15]
MNDDTLHTPLKADEAHEDSDKAIASAPRQEDNPQAREGLANAQPGADASGSDSAPDDSLAAPSGQGLSDDGVQAASEQSTGQPDGAEGGCSEQLTSVDFSHPADVAEHMENLTLQEQVCMLSAMPLEEAAEALAELEERTRVELLENLDPDKAASIVGEMSPDDAADVLDELDEDHSVVLLSKLQSEDAEEIRNLMAFDPETAGGVMNTELIILSDDITADQAIQQIRSEIEDKEIPYYAYIVNPDDVLIGVLTLRDLITSPPGMLLKEEISDQDLITVPYDAGREEVARVIGHYNFMALPVVDYEGRLLGVISHDDVIDIMQELASEDMLGMVGAGQDESTDTLWFDSVKMRLPWLLVNMVNSAMSAGVVYLFDGSIAQMAILAVFMPMVANQAGNTGQQALAVMIRQLATEKFSRRKAWTAVLREAKISIANGCILGILVWLAVYAFSANTVLTNVLVSALMLDMFIGAFAGASIPIILKELGRDPAQASSIFLTAITDGMGFFLFLGLATVFLL